MQYIALIVMLAVVLIVATWRIPGAIVTMHKNGLDHQHRTRELQDTIDGNIHHRFLEMQASQREIPELELTARAADASARQAEAVTRRIETELRARNRR